MNNSNQIMLTDVATNFVGSVKMLDKMAESVGLMPTDQLGSGYAMIKAHEKGLDALIKSVRDEFIGTQNKDKTYNEDGRLFTEGEKDGRGLPFIEFDDGTVLKASKSQKTVFNEKMAEEVLNEHNLVAHGSDTSVTGDSENILSFMSYLNDRVLPKLNQEDRVKLAEEVSNTFTIQYNPNQEKIMGLITTGQLPKEAVDGMFTTKETYSLLIGDNPYKPK